MKNAPRNIMNVQDSHRFDEFRVKEFYLTHALNVLLQHVSSFIHSISFSKILDLYEKIKTLGITSNLDEYESRKLRVFNLLNFFQFIFGLAIPISAAYSTNKISTLGWVAACMPALVSLLVLFLNSRRNYEVSTLCYFILYPVITSIVYLSGMNLGIELFFILYGILAVFFIQDIGHMIFTVTLSMISYFILTVVWRNFQFQLEVNGMLYLFNHLIAIIFIFFGLFLVKKENQNYQLSILENNRQLHLKNTEIESQRIILAENAVRLNNQAIELQDLNNLKNKLFSVIAHDLKSPMYALRNIFQNIEKYDLPAEDVKAMIPDVVKDLNYTTTLMENLLQWAKCQMQTLEVRMGDVNMREVAQDVFDHQKTQADLKNIRLVNNIKRNLMVTAQHDMIQLVLRNLVSNAIKFTPENGCVQIGCESNANELEIYVKDSGIGLSPSYLDKISNNEYFTTRGTSSEKGTGLGLMLCKEFLAKHNGTLHITSEEGVGSRFSFTLLKAEMAVLK
ncbi:MAG TPA: HAMP domain-containing sensor histidine kinase [Flavitalea sp.]|nr:HAMP domain-containing sensor histidine kinase [Flavitalea sp.]